MSRDDHELAGARGRSITTRGAHNGDAAAAIDVVRRSIVSSCKADHHGDPATLAAWLSNKTPANFVTWIGDPENHCVIAEREGRLCGVGLLHCSGKIRLFYIDPDQQRQGAGRAIHAALERQAHAWKLPRLHLDSTAHACAFYEALGYRSTGPACPRVGVLRCFPYEKRFDEKRFDEKRLADEGGPITS